MCVQRKLFFFLNVIVKISLQLFAIYTKLRFQLDSIFYHKFRHSRRSRVKYIRSRVCSPTKWGKMQMKIETNRMLRKYIMIDCQGRLNIHLFIKSQLPVLIFMHSNTLCTQACIYIHQLTHAQASTHTRIHWDVHVVFFLLFARR